MTGGAGCWPNRASKERNSAARYAAEADTWLSGLAERAAGDSRRHLALVAVGGYGRRSLCPYSDLDVVLVHNGYRDIKTVADGIWYPVWDEGVHLDHSVRRPSEVLSAAADDARVALGLLDGRLVWGEAKVAEPLLVKARAAWRDRLASKYLPLLELQMAERRATAGDVAFLLEPDLKESHGGLRDVIVCAPSRPSLHCWPTTPTWHRSRARPRCSPTSGSSSTAWPDVSTTSCCSKTRIRWRTRWASRTRTHSCWPSRRPAVRSPGSATTCGAGGGSGTRPHPRSVASAAARPTRAGRPHWSELGPDMVEVDGEIALTPLAPVSDDASLPLRLAATAAGLDRPIARGSLHRLADRMPPPSDPWTDETREALVALLGLGRPAVDKIESLDQHGLLVRLIPEWSAVRNKPQRNAYHTYTVDRHLLEAAALAAELTGRVERPDLLLVGALLHDIGKGFPGDHTAVGMEVVEHITTRMGFAPADVDILVDLVRHPSPAARRGHASRPRRSHHDHPCRPRRRQPADAAPPGRPDRGGQPRHRAVRLGRLEGRPRGGPRGACGPRAPR